MKMLVQTKYPSVTLVLVLALQLNNAFVQMVREEKETKSACELYHPRCIGQSSRHPRQSLMSCVYSKQIHALSSNSLYRRFRNHAMKNMLQISFIRQHTQTDRHFLGQRTSRLRFLPPSLHFYICFFFLLFISVLFSGHREIIAQHGTSAAEVKVWFILAHNDSW